MYEELTGVNDEISELEDRLSSLKDRANGLGKDYMKAKRESEAADKAVSVSSLGHMQVVHNHVSVCSTQQHAMIASCNEITSMTSQLTSSLQFSVVASDLARTFTLARSIAIATTRCCRGQYCCTCWYMSGVSSSKICPL